MASSSAESASKCHVRSVSFPSRSHPVWPDWRTCICVANLLDMASTQQILRRQVGCTNVLLDSSILLDICSITRDLVSQVKEYVHLLQSTLRRRKGDTSMKASLRDYVNFRNKARKDARRLNLVMNQIKNRAGAASQPNQDLESSAVTRMPIEADELSMATFQSVLHPFLNHVSGIKPTRWLSISRFVQKTAIACEEKRGKVAELEYIDGAINALSKCSLDDEETTKIQLQDAENSINSVEVGLENMFRQLISSRASLLNIKSQ